MTHTSRWAELKRLVREELQLLMTLKPSDRLWQMPFAAALATGLPLLIGAYFDHLDYGLVSSLGGLVFLYLPNTPLSHRMVTLMAGAFAMTACYTLGAMSHFFPLLMMPVLVLVFIAILATMVCRFYDLGRRAACSSSWRRRSERIRRWSCCRCRSWSGWSPWERCWPA